MPRIHRLRESNRTHLQAVSNAFSCNTISMTLSEHIKALHQSAKYRVQFRVSVIIIYKILDSVRSRLETVGFINRP